MNQLGSFLHVNLDSFGVPYDDFLNLIVSKGAAICGGFALGLATGKVFDDSDIDIFQTETEKNDNLEVHIRSIVVAFYRWKYRLDCSKTQYPYRMLSFFRMIGGCKKIIQWIVQAPDKLSHPIDKFDITVCCTTIEFPHGIDHPIIRCLYPHDIFSKFIKINPLSMVGTNGAWSESKRRTALRIVKYMKRGYICDPSSPSSLDEFLNLIVPFNCIDEPADVDHFPATEMCTTPPRTITYGCPERPTKKK